MPSLLTTLRSRVYASPVAHHGRPGLASWKPSAKALTRSAFFAPAVPWRVTWGLFGARFLGTVRLTLWHPPPSRLASLVAVLNLPGALS